MPSTLHHCQHKFSHSISNYRSNVCTRTEIARKCTRCIMHRQCCRYSRNNLGFGPLLAFDCDFAVESSRLRFYCNLWLHVRLFFFHEIANLSLQNPGFTNYRLCGAMRSNALWGKEGRNNWYNNWKFQNAVGS